MDILKFKLSGKSAFFKMPEVNTYYYFTYGNVHKVVLMGIFGAVLGYDGYQQQEKNQVYPEFYERLKELAVSVVPKEESKGYIPKKVQSFNNSVGYASQEAGGNLIIKQQWLERPEWEIYLRLDCDEAQKIKEYFLQGKCVYVPYLGSNDHPANITSVQLLKGELIQHQEIDRIHSIVPADSCEFDYDDEDVIPFKYQEFLPMTLNPDTNLYELKKMVYTNLPVLNHSADVVRVGEKNIIFY